MSRLKYIITVCLLFFACIEMAFAGKICVTDSKSHGSRGRHFEVRACYHPAAKPGSDGTIVSNVRVWSNHAIFGTEASYRIVLYDSKQSVLGTTKYHAHSCCANWSITCKHDKHIGENFRVDSDIAPLVKSIAVQQQTGTQTDLAGSDMKAITEGILMLIPLIK